MSDHITVEERKNARVIETGSDPRIERLYNVIGATDENEAEIALRDHAPAALFGLPQRGAVAEEMLVDEFGDPYGWRGRITWSPFGAAQFDPGEANQSFSIGGQVVNVQQSLSVVSSAGDPAPAPNFGGAIGVTDRGVEGIDVLRPHFEYELSVILPDDPIFGPDFAELFAMTNTVNSAPYGIFAAGENMLKGVRGRLRPSPDVIGESEWHLQFSFAARPNESSVSVEGMNLGAKDGWDAVWVYYQRDEDDSGNLLVRKPRAAYIVRVYERADHTNLPV